MNRLLLGFVLITLCWACQSEEEYPKDLEGKKKMLKEKRSERKELDEVIDQLTAEIQGLDPAFEQQKRLVTTMPVERKPFHRYVRIQGSIASDNSVGVSTEIAGRIVRLHVREGQSVRRGQLLAELDMETVRKQVAEIETALDLAKIVYERQKRLWDQNIGSEIQYLEAKNNKERLEKSMETVRAQLAKARIHAPITGVIDKKLADQGELAVPGFPIVEIIDPNKVKVVADLPESYLKVVRKHDPVLVKVPAADLETKGRIDLLGSTIDAANRTLKLEVHLRNRNGLLKPNLLAELLINDYSLDDAMVVPEELVQHEISGQEFVLINRDGSARKVYVKTGESYEGEVVIVEGLTGDEALILKGARSLEDGDLIEVAQENEG